MALSEPALRRRRLACLLLPIAVVGVGLPVICLMRLSAGGHALPRFEGVVGFAWVLAWVMCSASLVAWVFAWDRPSCVALIAGVCAGGVVLLLTMTTPAYMVFHDPVESYLGLAFPAIFGALIGTMLGEVPARIIERRDRRVAHGACRKCGYSLEGIDASVCPECGSAAEARNA